MNNLHTISHPLIAHKIAILRDKNTNHTIFRQTSRELSQLLLYEVVRDYPTEEGTVETPLEKAEAHYIAREICIILVMRAGLAMAEGVLDLIPEARVGHIGIERDEETLEPKEYYVRFPEDIKDMSVIVVDPMLATGGSASRAIEVVKKTGAEHISFMSIVAAPEGIQFLEDKHPDVPVYTGALDRELNDVGYILPGLGDAGDRMFGTK